MKIPVFNTSRTAQMSLPLPWSIYYEMLLAERHLTRQLDKMPRTVHNTELWETIYAAREKIRDAQALSEG